jgi:hypothetical protein
MEAKEVVVLAGGSGHFEAEEKSKNDQGQQTRGVWDLEEADPSGGVRPCNGLIGLTGARQPVGSERVANEIRRWAI